MAERSTDYSKLYFFRDPIANQPYRLEPVHEQKWLTRDRVSELFTGKWQPPEPILLKPAMTLKARVVHLKKVPAGFKVSYGMTYETKEPTTIASIPVGYADGFRRLLSNRGRMLDVGHIADVEIEDEVVIFGRQGDAVISADEVAALLNTINYEIVSALTARIPVIYR